MSPFPHQQILILSEICYNLKPRPVANVLDFKHEPGCIRAPSPTRSNKRQKRELITRNSRGLFKISFANLDTIGFDNQMQNGQRGIITELLFRWVFYLLFFLSFKCVKEKLTAALRVHLLIMAPLSHSFGKKKQQTAPPAPPNNLAVLTCFSASFVKTLPRVPFR